MMKKIPHFNNYKITIDGKVWSIISNKWLKTNPVSKYGHLQVSLMKNKKRFNKATHRLVLETFVGPCPEGMECRHLDGNPSNNRLYNLCWGTRSENCLDAVKHGTSPGQKYRGENSYQSKLTEQDVRMIIYMYQTGEFSQREIAAIYNVDPKTVFYIVHKITWKHIKKEIESC